MLYKLFDLFINIIIVVFIIFILNLYITKRLSQHNSELFLNSYFPNKTNLPKAVNEHDNNDYNDLLSYIYEDISPQLFTNDKPLYNIYTDPKENDDNELLKNVKINNVIQQKPNSNLPYNDQVKPKSLINNNYLNNDNNEIKAQMPEYLNLKAQNSELLNNNDNINGFDKFDISLNSQFELLAQ
jgi:hypothetical protein